MVDWATVAASGVAGSVGILATVLIERRRELVDRIQRADQRVDAVDGRLRALETEQNALRPGATFWNDMATKALKKALGQVEE